jgi:hypothetical protein
LLLDSFLEANFLEIWKFLGGFAPKSLFLSLLSDLFPSGRFSFNFKNFRGLRPQKSGSSFVFRFVPGCWLKLEHISGALPQRVWTAIESCPGAPKETHFLLCEQPVSSKLGILGDFQNHLHGGKTFLEGKSIC